MDRYLKQVMAELEKIMPEGCSAEITEVKKNNSVGVQGIIIKSNEDNISPVFYVTDTETPAEEFARNTMKRYEFEMRKGLSFDVGKFSDTDWVKENIIFDIVNRKLAPESIAGIPITDDLMIQFKIRVQDNASIKVMKSHLKMWGIDENELFEHARKNAMIFDRHTFRSFQDTVNEMMISNIMHDNDCSREEAEAFVSNFMPPTNDDLMRNMHILSTVNGSDACLLYESVLDDIKSELGDDLIIIPSSVHELLVVGKQDAERMGLESIQAMVHEVNSTAVDKIDFLSDNIFLYDGESIKQITSCEEQTYTIDDER